MRSRQLLALVGLISLLFAACGSRHIQTNSHIDWGAPLFLDSGKIGFFQVAWDEVYATCGYTGNDMCSEPRHARAYFMTFSPADSSLDTVFEAAARKYDFDISVRSLYQAPWLYYVYAGTQAAYNMVTGEHRTFPNLDVFLGSFSRSGGSLVYDQRRVDVATGAAARIILSPWQIDYYDDVADKAILYRWENDIKGYTTRYMVLYDFATGDFDSTRVWPGVQHVRAVDGGRIVLWGNRAVEGGRKWAFARAQTLDIADPALDSVLILSTRDISDLDLEGRRLLGPGKPGQGFGAHESGIVLADFQGVERTYHARTFHPEYPPEMPSPP